MHSSVFFFLSRYKIAPGTSSSFSFTFSCFFFQFHLPLCYFGCILLFFFFLSRYKIAPGTSSSFSFTFSCFFFQFHLPLCYFGCILLFFFFFQGIKLPQAHLHSASHFHVFSFNSTFRFATLSCFNPAETFLFSFRHVCLHSRPRK